MLTIQKTSQLCRYATTAISDMHGNNCVIHFYLEVCCLLLDDS